MHCFFLWGVFLFTLVLSTFTFSKMFRVLTCCLQKLQMKLLFPGTQTASFQWSCLIWCFINKLFPLRRKSLNHLPHGKASHSGVSAASLFNLVHLKYCVYFCCHLSDLSYFLFHFSFVFLKCFSNIHCPTFQQPIKQVNVISPILQMRLREFPDVICELKLTFSWIHSYMHTGSRAKGESIVHCSVEKKTECLR